MTNPIVSICCATYNHASFIRKALDGFLMQEPPAGVSKDESWYEILIHDDASTDGTTEIIKEYAAKYPNKIFPLYETENQYSKGHVADIDMYNYKRAKGRYIAYCEGDDYWTDVHKLQKQVDFMESHPEYSICMHGCSVYDTRTHQQYASVDILNFSQSPYKNQDGIEFTAKDFYEGRYGQPLTMLFRVSMYDFNWHKRFKYYRDTHEIYLLLKAGKGYWLNFDGGVYIKHNGGISSGINRVEFCDVSLPMDREFYWKTLFPYAKKQYIDTLESSVRAYADIHPFKAMRCAMVLFILTRHPRGVMRHIKTIMSGRRKINS